jgi:membrane protease subunit HflK
MAWNEPGGGNRDPWGGRGNNDQGPPDLDEVVRKMQDKFGGLFGGRKGSGGGGAGRGAGGFGIGLIIGLAVLVWLASGIYIVDEAERGVVLRFGEYQKTVGPGPHWHIPYPVDSVLEVNVDALRTTQHSAQMLTKDENLMRVGLSVQYQVKNAENYLFNVRNADYTLKEALESAVREVVGSKTLDDILSETGGRLVLVNETQEHMQKLLDRYGAGLQVVKANLESAQPPQEVQGAFEDAIKAREDQDRLKKRAEAYARDIIPKAEGTAQGLIEEAEAYKQRVVSQSQGETSRFLQTLAEYKQAPAVTRNRLYLENMQQVLQNSSKVLVPSDQGNNIMYLPLDQLMRNIPGRSSGQNDSDSDVYRSSSSSGQSNSGNTQLREGR